MNGEYNDSKEYMEKIKKQIFKNLSDDGEDNEYYSVVLQNLFLKTEDGPAALEWFLKHLKYNSEIKNPYEIVLHNMAVRLLEKLDLTKNGIVADHVRNWTN